jgi:hypothetical protein
MSDIYKDFTEDHDKENLMMEWDLSTKDLGKSASYEEKVNEFDYKTAATKYTSNPCIVKDFMKEKDLGTRSVTNKDAAQDPDAAQD